MSEQGTTKGQVCEWGSLAQVKFVIGFVKETKRQGYEMCPLHVDFLLPVLERYLQYAFPCDCIERGEPDIDCPNHGIDAVQGKRAAQASVHP